MRIATPDLISNSHFPLLAADGLGLFKAEGLDVSIEVLPAERALRRGEVDLAVGAQSMLREFPGWQGAKLVVALSQQTPWLLVVRADLAASRGDLNAIKGMRILAGGGPVQALKQMAVGVGLIPGRDFELIVNEGATRGPNVSVGVVAAQALAEGQIDGFWANALAAETAVESGRGKVLVDVRRGDDPANVRLFTFGGLATTDAYLESNFAEVEAVVRAVVKAQRNLRSNPSLAREVGEGKFPPDEATLIVRTIERDVEFYDPTISEEAVASMNAFAQNIGQLEGPVPYDQVVDVRMRQWWT